MTVMFNPNRPLTPEERRALEAALAQSGRTDEKGELANQRALANMLASEAFESNARSGLGGGSRVGGIAGGLAQGLKGYMAAERLNKSDADYLDFRNRGIGNRRTIMDWLHGGGEPAMLVPGGPGNMEEYY